MIVGMDKNCRCVMMADQGFPHMQKKAYAADMLAALKEALGHLETLHTITPQEPGLIRAKESLREKITDLERQELKYRRAARAKCRSAR